MKHFEPLIIILLLISTIHFNKLNATEISGGFNYKHLTIREGLCDNSIRAIYKDKNNFVWIGTTNGLDRYDGYDLKHYSTSSTHPSLFIESNYINDIKEDNTNHLWVASESGLMRIDLLSEKIDFFKNYKGNNSELLFRPIQCLYIDDFQNIWIGKNDGLAYVVLNEKKEIVDIKTIKKEVDINTIIKHGNDVWTGGSNGLFRFTISNSRDINNVPITINLSNSNQSVNALFSVGEYLWIGTQRGLYCYNTQNKSHSVYRHDARVSNSLSSDYVTDINKNSSGDIIVATRNGVNIYQHNNQFVSYVKESQSVTLNDNVVNKILVDENDNIWAGSDFGGIRIMRPKRINFSYELQGYENGVSNTISAILEDKEGNILVGIVDRGLAIKRKGTAYFSFYKHNPSNLQSLSQNNISDIIQDSNGDFWISTIGGGIDKLKKEHLQNPVFEHFNVSNTNLLSNDIYDLAFDSIRASVWMCSNDHIYVLDIKTNTINRLQYYTHSKESIKNVTTIFIDSQSRLWIGGNGVYTIDLANAKIGNECIYYQYKLDKPESKINEKITCIYETQNKSIYLGSLGNGIYLLDKNSKYGNFKFINYGVRSGLSDTSISDILEDDRANLWISTLKGIYFFDTKTNRAFKYDEGDGLTVQQFYRRAGYKQKNHTIMLGSINGLVSFSSILNVPKQVDRKVTLTKIMCNGVELVPYLNNKNIATSIFNAKELNLYPPQNSFELSFSSMDYTDQDKVFYFYRILELKEKSNTGLKNRSARYTNLSPGKYTLEIWCTNYNNTWSSERTYLTIMVHPPFYKTTWFYSLIALMVVSILVYIVYSYYDRQKKTQQMLKEKIEERTLELNHTISELTDSQNIIIEQNEQLQLQNEEIRKQSEEIVKMSEQVTATNKEKLSYFTNMAHEFKTPLTLILGPTNQLLNETKDYEKKNILQIIYRNSQYLLSLVNQLIDLRKIDTNNLSVHLTQFNLLTFLDNTVSDFLSVMKDRELKFQQFYHLKSDYIFTDKDTLQKILLNLISNAVKYTPNRGHIKLYIGEVEDKLTEQLMLYIAVSNSGSNIDVADIDKIFNRFYKVQNQPNYSILGHSSTGIGLHIVKELVALLKGTIKVKSTEKKEVVFRLYFPVTLPATVETDTDDNRTIKPVVAEDIIEPFIVTDREKPTLLLVEDNADMRFYIKSILVEKYNVAEANNGKNAYAIAQNIIPDFIVSDLMMPVCDGATFCQKIRENENLCHIPFLLLTANSSETARIESYECGVDGYLTKPFEETVLLARIDSILKNRDLRQKKFVEEDLNVSLLEVGYSDKHFMDEVMTILEENYTDPEFGVKEMADKLNISYTLIYKKFTSLTGLPPVRFILLYRLQLAKKILENNKNNNIIVSDIAYRVGFNDPKYFSRCFVKQFHITPSSIIR